MATSYMVAVATEAVCSDSGYISLAEDDIVLVVAESNDAEYAYVQLIHSDAVGWTRLSLLRPAVLSPNLPSFHLTFAIAPEGSLMCQLVVRDTQLGDIYWSGVSFAGWSPVKRRPHISLNGKAPEWDAAYLELLISDLEGLYRAKTGRPLCFVTEIHHGRFWYTSREPIIILTALGVRAVESPEHGGDKRVYFEPESQLIRQWRCVLLLLGQVACSRKYPQLGMRELGSLHLSCAAYCP